MQIAVPSTELVTGLRANLSPFEDPDGIELPSNAIRIYFVGYIPVEELHPAMEGFPGVEEITSRGVSGNRAPDVVGDPLLEGNAIDVPSKRANPCGSRSRSSKMLPQRATRE